MCVCATADVGSFGLRGSFADGAPDMDGRGIGFPTEVMGVSRGGPLGTDCIDGIGSTSRGGWTESCAERPIAASRLVCSCIG